MLPIIADCTPDLSQMEELSLIVKLSLLKTLKIIIKMKDFFFFQDSDSTKDGLIAIILTKL